MRKACCICDVITQPGDGPVSHGFCQLCKGWQHEFNHRQIQGDPSASQDAFEQGVIKRRLLRKFNQLDE